MYDHDPPLYRDAARPTDPAAKDRGVHPGERILPAGSVHSRGGLALPVDLHLHQDVHIVMRDGAQLRADVWRPSNTGTFATVLAYTPYGKQGGYWGLDNFPFRAGVARGAVSGLQSFESPDPAYWCAHGYAVVVVDARGSSHSEGDIRWWGTQGGQDGHDVVEWVAAQPWSTGRVGMTGNSQLAIIQWFTAATRPPHLTAIAPWEGLSDMYRDNLATGGIPFPSFNEDVLTHQYGLARVEDIPAMIDRDPLLDSPHWADKAARLEEIDIPAYVVASFTNPLHSAGTLSAFRRLRPELSWLRIHNAMEWSDYYAPDSLEDLRRYFDHFLYDIDNGWERTPRVRSAVLDLGGRDDVDVSLDQWPPSEVTQVTYHLDAGGDLSRAIPSPGRSSYQMGRGAGVEFRHRFDTDTVLAGHASVRLWMETNTGTDLDVFVLVDKLSRRGKPRYRNVMPPPVPLVGRLLQAAYRRGLFKMGFIFYRGLEGRLRASHRRIDEVVSTDLEPHHPHTAPEPVTPGEVVQLDIALSPAVLRWRAGETLRLTISGSDPRGFWFPSVPPPDTVNVGMHTVHTGGDRASSLTVAELR